DELAAELAVRPACPQVADLRLLPLAHSDLLEPVVARGRFRADEPLGDVPANALAVTPPGIAVASPTRHQDLDLVALAERDSGELGRGERPELLDEGSPAGLPGAPSPEPADRTTTPADHAPRLGLHPVEERADRHLGHRDDEDALAAEPAPELAGPARVRYQAVGVDAEGGVASLEHLDRRVATVPVDHHDHDVTVHSVTPTPTPPLQS